MISSRIRPIPQSIARSFPIDIFHLGEFKALLNRQVHQLGIANKFKPRLYSYADYIMVKFYAVIRNISVHNAAETLNLHCKRYFQKKFHKQPKSFSDFQRQRRLVPHQTDVDKFFRLLTEQEVHILFGNIIMVFCQKIVTKIGRGQRWRLLVDNTEYAYYGKLHPTHNQGSLRHQGTRFIRLFQGHSLHAGDITLFYDFFLLKKGQYRSASIPQSVQWCKWNKIPLSYALMDREFYRAALIKRLKTLGLPVIIPAKKYPRVKKEFMRYLLGLRPLSDIYYFSQAKRAKPWPSSIHLHLVIVGHKMQPAWEIRELYRQKKLTFDAALQKLAGFFTTMSPWKNVPSWSRWLMRTYKKRWNQETGFRMLNALHWEFRSQHAENKLADLFLRALIYNGWQFYRHDGRQKGWKERDLTEYWYQIRLTHQIEEEIIDSARKKIKGLQKGKRRLYFDK